MTRVAAPFGVVVAVHQTLESLVLVEAGCTIQRFVDNVDSCIASSGIEVNQFEQEVRLGLDVGCAQRVALPDVGVGTVGEVSVGLNGIVHVVVDGGSSCRSDLASLQLALGEVYHTLIARVGTSAGGNLALDGNQFQTCGNQFLDVVDLRHCVQLSLVLVYQGLFGHRIRVEGIHLV